MATVDLIGSSPKFQAVLDKISLVASVDCSVLVHGETGTGKEVIAKAIHDASPRQHHAFVAINCAAIPAALFESELFGHKRGAFTGAVSQAMGRFQLADGGTLFLDEIGDLPLELQPKLLRVLQERRFEPLGSGRSLQVDARVIAATNQDLSRMMQEGKFRADLYYRLKVFPVDVPPLRERREDIPLLTEHFVRKFAMRQGKFIREIPEDVMEVLQFHSWPGNIRELQNFIEHAVITATGPVLRPQMAELMTHAAEGTPGRTLTEAERAHIIAALRDTNWVIGGRNGAAARLGLPRTTLIGKMKRLGISPEIVQPTDGRSLPRRTTASSAYAPGSHGIERVSPINKPALIDRRHQIPLYQHICEAVTDPGGYVLAWIGLVQDDPRKSVRIVARAGPCSEYVSGIEITWGDDRLGQGPAGRSIRAGEIRITNDLEKDPRFLPWCKRASSYRCKSSIALPLRCEGKLFGILSIYAAEPYAFRVEEMKLVQDLADELLNLRLQGIGTRDYPKLISRRLGAIRECAKACFESVQFREDRSPMPIELNVRAFDYNLLPDALGVAYDVSEHSRAESEIRVHTAEIEVATAEPERGDDVDSQFLASIGDEVRISIDSIVDMTNLLLDARLEPGQQDMVETIRQSAQALRAIVNDIPKRT